MVQKFRCSKCHKKKEFESGGFLSPETFICKDCFDKKATSKPSRIPNQPTEEEVTLDQVGKIISQVILEFTKRDVDEISKDPESPFSSIDIGAFHHELVVLAFWNLRFLGLKREVFASVINDFLAGFGTGRQKELDFI